MEYWRLESAIHRRTAEQSTAVTITLLHNNPRHHHQQHRHHKLTLELKLTSIFNMHQQIKFYVLLAYIESVSRTLTTAYLCVGFPYKTTLTQPLTQTHTSQKKRKLNFHYYNIARMVFSMAKNSMYAENSIPSIRYPIKWRMLAKMEWKNLFCKMKSHSFQFV